MVEDDQRPVILPFQGVQRCHERARVRAFVERLAEGGNVVDEHHFRKIRHGCFFYSLQYIINEIVSVHLRTEEGRREVRNLVPQGQLTQCHLKVGIEHALPLCGNIPCHLHGEDDFADA